MGRAGHRAGRSVLERGAALHYKLKGAPSADWAILIPVEGDGVQISLSKVSSPKARRHHIDLFTDDQEAEVKRLIGLGATRKEWMYPPEADYVVLQDPDGNPFSASCSVDVTALVPRRGRRQAWVKANDRASATRG